MAKLILDILEYNKKILTKLAGGNAKLGCYGLAVAIFTLGITRDLLYVVMRNY
jgi:phosphatidylethanolamine N-methyltransferase